MRTDTPPGPSPRLPALDVARGVAVAAMVGYHLAWDLSFLRLVETDIGAHPAWQWVARSIAGSFLALVGVGLVLAHGRGLRARAFLRRLAVVAGAAGLVSAATLLAFPDRWIFFGVLHCIAVSSVLALPFLRLPLPLVVATAGLVLAAPRWLTSPVLDGGMLDVLGLGLVTPLTNDYVPLFPWFALVLVGVAGGRVGLPRLAGRAGAPAGPFRRALAWAGRRSLPVYLLHQPVLLGLLWGYVQLFGQNQAAERADLGRICRAICAEKGRPAEQCGRACACVVETSAREGLVRVILRDRASPGQSARIREIADGCFGPGG